jgi:cation diffusion facilitator family transporter
MVLKFAVGTFTGSVAIFSDAIDSAEDAIASTFAFISIRIGSQPADLDHPYGHGKAESLAAAAQGLLITAGAALIVYTAIGRLVDRDVEIKTGIGLIALVVTAAVNVAVVLYVGRAAKATGSVALVADTRHLWTNVAQAIAIGGALVLVAVTGNTIFDPVMALVLAAYLFWTAGRVFQGALGEIMDVRLPEEEEAAIVAVLRDQERNGVRGYHALRTRKAGRERYIDVHILVDPAQSVTQAHALSDAIEAGIRERVPGAVVGIHIEPDDGSQRDKSVTLSHPERER